MPNSTNLTQKCTLLEKENADLKNLIQSIPGCVYWKDLQGVYLGCNQLFVEMAGLSLVEEVIGKTDRDFCWKEQSETLRRHDIEVMLSNESRISEETVVLGRSLYIYRD